MERAGRLIARLQAQGSLSTEELTLAAWPAAIGKRLASKTKAVAMVRDRLVVEVEDSLWQRNLNALRQQILKNLADLLGPRAPAEITFRVAIQRRPPQRAEPAAAAGLFGSDEADRIADPVMRRIYMKSRRKAGA